tara:strand:+ start:1003 stop:1767 length:765 start_codon:yes stop_codon:yes gene_type:complete
MNILVFDIETIPDVEAGRKIYGLEDLNDADAAEAMFLARREKNGTNFLPTHLQKVAAISVVLRTADKVNVWSLGELASDERDIIQRFYDGVERYTPTLVSWNGSGFDLPVLHYRALANKISAPRYWDNGCDDNTFKWNNYLSRFHERHTDLMDVLAAYQARANAPLDEVATMLGFPGKMGMSGAKVWDNYQAGDLAGIRDYCETDVLNTYLVYLRFQLMRGRIGETQLQEEEQLLRDYLANENKPHFNEFIESW